MGGKTKGNKREGRERRDEEWRIEGKINWNEEEEKGMERKRG